MTALGGGVCRQVQVWFLGVGHFPGCHRLQLAEHGVGRGGRIPHRAHRAGGDLEKFRGKWHSVYIGACFLKSIVFS